MIKASELRIGNYVQGHKIPIWNIDQTDFQGGRIDPDNGMMIQWEPIQLTEEWFYKFGFKDNYRESVKGQPWYKCGYKKNPHPEKSFSPIVEIQAQAPEGDEWGIRQQEYFYHNSPRLKYVHQLQNLYFALTGEELNIQE